MSETAALDNVTNDTSFNTPSEALADGLYDDAKTGPTPNDLMALSGLGDEDEGDNADSSGESEESDGEERGESEESDGEERGESEESDGGERVESEESDGDSVQTLAELAESYDTDLETLTALKAPVKINGKESEVSIQDALDAYQKVGAGDDYLAQAKEKADAEISNAQTQSHAMGEAAVTFGSLVQKLEKQYAGERDSAEMKKLRADDPDEWRARQHELDNRQKEIDSIKQEAVNVYGELKEKTAAASQSPEDLAAARAEEREILLKNLPEWADPKTGQATDEAKAELAEVRENLAKSGFSEEDVTQVINNGRALTQAVKALRYDKAAAKARKPAATKKRKVLKSMKPGSDQGTGKTNAPKSDDPVSILYG